MRFNEKKAKTDIESDDMDIKSHLRHSLELKDITVSEDLILRTVEAVKEQSQLEGIVKKEEGLNKENRKTRFWNRNTRSFAMACVAVLVVVSAYAIVHQFPVGRMKSASDTAAPEMGLMSKENTAATPADSAAGLDSNTIMEGDVGKSADAGSAVQFSIESKGYGSIEEPNNNDSTNSESMDLNESIKTQDTAENIETDDTQSKEAADQRTFAANIDAEGMNIASEEMRYTFRDIFIPSPEQAEYIKITDNQSAASVTLSDFSDIQAFYLIMDNYEFTGTGTEDTSGINYSVEMKNQDTQLLYTMLVGNDIIIRCIQGDNVTENIYYTAEEDLFAKKIEEFYLEHSVDSREDQ